MWEGVWEAAQRLGVPVVLRAEGVDMDEVSLRRVCFTKGTELS
jgi:hypothetical protein